MPRQRSKSADTKDSNVLISVWTEHITREHCEKVVNTELNKGLEFYMSRNKINKEQANKIYRHAFKKLTNEWITDDDKIKLVLKEYIIFELHKTVNELKTEQTTQILSNMMLES